jgi:hypothetical protein
LIGSVNVSVHWLTFTPSVSPLAASRRVPREGALKAGSAVSCLSIYLFLSLSLSLSPRRHRHTKRERGGGLRRTQGALGDGERRFTASPGEGERRFTASPGEGERRFTASPALGDGERLEALHRVKASGRLQRREARGVRTP